MSQWPPPRVCGSCTYKAVAGVTLDADAKTASYASVCTFGTATFDGPAGVLHQLQALADQCQQHEAHVGEEARRVDEHRVHDLRSGQAAVANGGGDEGNQVIGESGTRAGSTIYGCEARGRHARGQVRTRLAA